MNETSNTTAGGASPPKSNHFCCTELVIFESPSFTAAGFGSSESNTVAQPPKDINIYRCKIGHFGEIAASKSYVDVFDFY